MKIVCDGKELEVAGSSSQEIYSTEEQVIGKWIDGKPLYRKVVTVTTPTANGNNIPIMDLTSLNIERTISIIGSLNTDNAINTVPYYVNSNTYIFFYIGGPGNTKPGWLNVSLGPSYVNKEVFVVLEYTKTTDQATIQLDSQPLQPLSDMSAANAMPVTAGLYNDEV